MTGFFVFCSGDLSFLCLVKLEFRTCFGVRISIFGFCLNGLSVQTLQYLDISRGVWHDITNIIHNLKEWTYNGRALYA